MTASQSQIVARVERSLPGEALHEVVHPADAGRVLLHLIGRIEGEFVVDRLLLLDRLLVQFGLEATIRVLWIFVVGLLAVARHGRGRTRRQWS
jgi:hypothetical protein